MMSRNLQEIPVPIVRTEPSFSYWVLFSVTIAKITTVWCVEVISSFTLFGETVLGGTAKTV